MGINTPHDSESKPPAPVAAHVNNRMLEDMLRMLPIETIAHVFLGSLASDQTLEADLAAAAVMNYLEHQKNDTLTSAPESEPTK